MTQPTVVTASGAGREEHFVARTVGMTVLPGSPRTSVLAASTPEHNALNVYLADHFGLPRPAPRPAVCSRRQSF